MFKFKIRFNKISQTYDLLNHMLSFGIDIYWRRIAASLAMKHYLHFHFHQHQHQQMVLDTEFSMLDIATGTGDLLFAILKKKRNSLQCLRPHNPHCLKWRTVAIDIEASMLELAKKKNLHCGIDIFDIDFQLADAVSTNYQDESFNLITSAFGVRNFYDLERGLSNIYRMLKRDGKLLILEFSAESINPILKPLFSLYLNYFVPVVGGMISKDFHAYDYLNKSARSFPSGDKFINILRRVGFSDIEAIPLTFGLVTIYLGYKKRSSET